MIKVLFKDVDSNTLFKMKDEQKYPYWQREEYLSVFGTPDDELSVFVNI